MGKFTAEESLSNIIRVMSLLGLWPKKFPSVLYRMLGFITLMIITIITITSVTAVLTGFADMSSASFALCCVTSSSLTLVKYFVLFTKKESFFNLMKMLNEPVLSVHKDHLDIFMIKKMKMCRYFQHQHLLSAVITGSLITIIPILDSKPVDRSLPVAFPMDVKQQSYIVYNAVWWLEAAAVMLTTIAIGCFDGLMFFFITIAAAELKILRERIVEATNFELYHSKNKKTQSNIDNAINKLLKDCIIQHIAIERYIISIHSTFTNAFLYQLIMSLLTICLLGFILILIPVKSVEFGMCVLFFLAASTQLILFCVPGNELTLQSEKVRDACYMSQWVNCGPSVRKTLFIIMERAKRPFVLSAGNFVDLSLDTLIRIFRSAFSYFTVLKKMYGDSK